MRAKVNFYISGGSDLIYSNIRRMDDFPGERDKPRADRRQSRDRDASKGGEGCNRDLMASATVAGGPTKCRSSE